MHRYVEKGFNVSKLYYLIGIPASGKTTWAKKFCNDTGAIHCSADDIRRTVFGGYNRQQTHLVYDILDDYVINELKSGKDVVYDTMGMYYFRERQLKKFKPLAECIAVYFPVSIETALKCDKERGTQISEDYIRETYELDVAPTIEEGFSDVIVIKR